MKSRAAESQSWERNVFHKLGRVLKDCHNLNIYLYGRICYNLWKIPNLTAGGFTSTCSSLHCDQKFFVIFAATARKATTVQCLFVISNLSHTWLVRGHLICRCSIPLTTNKPARTNCTVTHLLTGMILRELFKTTFYAKGVPTLAGPCMYIEFSWGVI